MNRTLIIVIVFYSAQISFGQATIKTMFYNVLNYPSAPPTNKEKLLETIIDSYEPDIFMNCELGTEAGGDEILNNSLNDDILSLQINTHTEPIDLKIYNTLGQEIKSFSATGNNITNIPVSALSKSICYLVPISINSNTIKFLKKS
ncbi:hypothetical protein [uncultured Aquimarina sp.]|uniref:hypothetical protein n=1 Tax=uncultured Aquimarina sp. TaxID=575652 RepID=UPI00262FF00E|nr:hypothetical protein [uncultured Aquimarina sp.]